MARYKYRDWKDKILDYEIETEPPAEGAVGQSTLEKIRFSITRLKRNSRNSQQLFARHWKDKILDYEIETQDHIDTYQPKVEVEKIRFSITRLKTRWCRRGTESPTCHWKDKILDYEIETSGVQHSHGMRSSSWKDKILDYEIETQFTLYSNYR